MALVEHVDAALDAGQRLDALALEPDEDAGSILVGPSADLLSLILGAVEYLGGPLLCRADEYAAGVLIRLEGECIKALTSIKRGIDMLDERHRAASDDGMTPSEGGAIAVDPQEKAQAAPRP